MCWASYSLLKLWEAGGDKEEVNQQLKSDKCESNDAMKQKGAPLC